jgi:1,4-dihydroxy-2-naphthoate polyprenyltransferase
MTAPGPWRRWVLAARPRTLPAAAVPVVVGVAAVRPATIDWLNGLLCLVVAFALHVGVNYANDYSDGIKGTDHNRVGPFRITASGLVQPRVVRRAAFTCFALACVAGVVLASRSSWWMVLIGATAVVAAWTYTGGPKPYGYLGLGELFVMIYFGLVATVGTLYAQHQGITPRSWWLGVAVGAMAVALLEANNLRDIDGDRVAHKWTLAARLGRQRASYLYVAAVVVVVAGFVLAHQYWPAVAAIIVYLRAIVLSRSPAQGRELLPLLKMSARAQLLTGIVATVFLATAR